MAKDRWLDVLCPEAPAELVAEANMWSRAPTYDQLLKLCHRGLNFCAATPVTGFIPSRIVAAIRHDAGEVDHSRHMVIAVDEGQALFVAGAVSGPARNGGAVEVVAHHVSHGFFMRRTGRYRSRSRAGYVDYLPSDATHVRNRRWGEIGRSQFYHEWLANMRMLAFQRTGRYPLILVESCFDTSSQSRGRAQLGHAGLRTFLGKRGILALAPGYLTSQTCGRCGGQLEFARPHDFRSKVCKSVLCVAARYT